MTNDKKDTIYIDVDDEITSIIEKVRSSPQKIVALVLPKRAAILQSIVNMKLLKRSSEEAKKHLVLITSEAALMPLAGAVGLYVAKTLLSKPIVPPPPPDPDAATDINPDEITEADAPIDAEKPVGELAGLTPEDETIEVDNDEPNTAAAGKPKKEKAPKGLRVPNFNKFRTKLLLAGVVGILLLIGFYMANFVMPAADVTIKTDTENINATVKFTSSPTTVELDQENSIVPAVTKELKKSEGQKAPATGQKNVGQKATGSVTLKNCTNKDGDIVIPANTPVTANGLSFVTDESVTLPQSILTGGSKTCITPTRKVDVVAQNAGDNYNLSERDYTVSGFAGVQAEGSDMEGGTNQIIKIVSQGDIDNLRQKIIDSFTNGAKEELKQQLLAESLIALEDTFNVGQPVAISSPDVNTEAGEVTVNVTMNFTMQGLKEEHITPLIDKAMADDIDSERQKISNYGLAEAIFQIGERKPNNDVSYTLQTIAVAGPEIDENALKQQIAGKKEGEAENIIKSHPGVKEASVNYRPFWVTKAPKKISKVNITIETIDVTPTDDEADTE